MIANSLPARTGSGPAAVPGPPPRGSRFSRGFVRGLPGFVATLAVAGAVVPVASAAQDTVRTPEPGWFGVLLSEATAPSAPLRQRSFRLVVADVYRNSPADVGGIVPGDWFVSVDGSPLSTYENWLRSTANLHAGQSMHVIVVRGDDRHEVTLIADPAPPFVAPNPLDGLDIALARLDSIFDMFVTVSPAAERWPPHPLPEIVFGGGFRADSGELTVTFGDSTIPAESGGVVTVTLRGRGSAQAAPPPSAGGGATELTGRFPEPGEIRFSILAPRLIERTMLFGGVEVRDLAELGPYFGVEKGVLVTDVIVGPGLLAGFRPGDVIISAEGRTFDNVRDLRLLLADLSTPIDLAVIRDKRNVKITYPRPER